MNSPALLKREVVGYFMRIFSDVRKLMLRMLRVDALCRGSDDYYILTSLWHLIGTLRKLDLDVISFSPMSSPHIVDFSSQSVDTT
jgi:hypothetical protein